MTENEPTEMERFLAEFAEEIDVSAEIERQQVAWEREHRDQIEITIFDEDQFRSA